MEIFYNPRATSTVPHLIRAGIHNQGLEMEGEGLPLLFKIIKCRAFGMSGISTGWLFSIGDIIGGHIVSGAFDKGGSLLAGW